MKHLPLFFDLAGRRVVVVGVGAMADRRAELARSAGAAVFQLEAVSAVDLKGAATVFVATGDLDRDSDARRAAKLSEYQNPDILTSLADAYADAGRLPEAVDAAEKALDAAQKNDPKLLAQIRSHLEELRARAKKPQN